MLKFDIYAVLHSLCVLYNQGFELRWQNCSIKMEEIKVVMKITKGLLLVDSSYSVVRSIVPE